MPQPLLPLVPSGATPISEHVSVVNEDGKWTYFVGVLPVFAHPQLDRDSFRMFTAQLVCNGNCKQVDIVRVFGAAPISVKRSVKQYREQGCESFYKKRRGRGASVMTETVVQQAQQLLNRGNSRKETAQKLNVLPDTLRKAINQGKLSATKPAQEPTGDTTSPDSTHDLTDQATGSEPTDKSQRGLQDAAAADGLEVACTRLVERCFQPLGGYYTTLQVFSSLGFMALCRIRTVEQLQYHPPGELGKLLGLGPRAGGPLLAE